MWMYHHYRNGYVDFIHQSPWLNGKINPLSMFYSNFIQIKDKNQKRNKNIWQTLFRESHLHAYLHTFVTKALETVRIQCSRRRFSTNNFWHYRRSSCKRFSNPDAIFFRRFLWFSPIWWCFVYFFWHLAGDLVLLPLVCVRILFVVVSIYLV